MEYADLHDDVWKGIRSSLQAGRLAHAYLLVGSPRGQALTFAEQMLKMLFCNAVEKPCESCSGCRQVDAHNHVDTHWIEPQSKSRQIRIAEIRELIRRLSQTSFGGGWKAGIILAADCMGDEAANALLKTLEEPAPKTLLLLVTDSPQLLLPTIASRCQRLILEETGNRVLDEAWGDPLMEVLRALPPAGGLEAARLAGKLKALFDVLKAAIADRIASELDQNDEALDESKLKVIMEARTSALLKEVQADVFRVVVEWQRDVLILAEGLDRNHVRFAEELEALTRQAALHTPASALRAVAEIEGMVRRQERNIPDLQIFDEAFRRLVVSP